jgi:hypothetical protein
METTSLRAYASTLLRKVESDPDEVTGFYCDSLELEALEELERQKKIVFIKGKENENKSLGFQVVMLYPYNH